MQVSRTCANWASLLILVRSEPRKLKPPVLRTKSTSASLISNSEPSSRPFGPALTPSRVLPEAENPLQAADDVVTAGGGAAREQDGDALALDLGGPAARGAEHDIARRGDRSSGTAWRRPRCPWCSAHDRCSLKLTGCGLSDEPKAAQTGSGSWRTADSKSDLCASVLISCSTRVLMVGSSVGKSVVVSEQGGHACTVQAAAPASRQWLAGCVHATHVPRIRNVLARHKKGPAQRPGPARFGVLSA
jgi:hypothetical protein